MSVDKKQSRTNMDIKEAVQAKLLSTAPDIDSRLQKYEAAMSRLTPRQRARVAFARIFRAEMRGLHITQKSLAEQLGVSPSLVSAWASAVSMPNAEQTEKLSELFNDEVSLWAIDEPLPEDPWESEDFSSQSNGSFAGEASTPSQTITAEEASTPSQTITADETALIQRVRRMSQDERDALYTLLHVLK